MAADSSPGTLPAPGPAPAGAAWAGPGWPPRPAAGRARCAPLVRLFINRVRQVWGNCLPRPSRPSWCRGSKGGTGGEGAGGIGNALLSKPGVGEEQDGASSPYVVVAVSVKIQGVADPLPPSRSPILLAEGLV